MWRKDIALNCQCSRQSQQGIQCRLCEWLAEHGWEEKYQPNDIKYSIYDSKHSNYDAKHLFYGIYGDSWKIITYALGELFLGSSHEGRKSS